MAAIAYTLVRATPYRLIYSWTGDAAGTLLNTTIMTDAVAGPLKTALTLALLECDSAAKATAAIITGASFVGAVTATVITSVQTVVVYQTLTTAKAPPALTAADSGAANAADLVLTPDGSAAAGWLFITRPPDAFI